MSTTENIWYNLEEGTSGIVYSICVFEGELYAVGNFEEPTNPTVSYIEKWNGSQWFKKNISIVGKATSCVVYNDALYVAGNFSSINSVSCTNIAKFNGSTWSAVGSVSKQILKLKVINSELYALTFSDETNNGVFKLNQTNQWINVTDVEFLGNNEPFNFPYFSGDESIIALRDIEFYSNKLYVARSNIFALQKYNNKLIVGGTFNDEGSILREFNGSLFLTYANGIPPTIQNATQTKCFVTDLKVYDNELYVAGIFDRVGTTSIIGGLKVNSLAKWNEITWSFFNYKNIIILINDIFNYYNFSTDENFLKNGLYIGGNFSYLPEINAKNIAVYTEKKEEEINFFDSLIPKSICEPIIPCGFTIQQPFRRSNECGPIDGKDGAQGPPGPPGAQDITSLSDVIITNIQNGDILKYDDEINAWVNVSGDITNLSDVIITNIQNGDILKYDDEINAWVNVSSLFHVTITNVENGDVLRYDNSINGWVNTSGDIANLSDVRITNIQNGDILRYNAEINAWVNVATGARPNLSRVVISNVQNGDVLKFDQEMNAFELFSKWVNTACGKIYFVSTQKADGHEFVWNNPIDTAQWSFPDASILAGSWAQSIAEASTSAQNFYIPEPGGGAQDAIDGNLFNSFAIDGVDDRGLPKVDLSSIDKNCDLVYDISSGAIYFPNPSWDGNCTGPLLGGVDNNSYYDSNNQMNIESDCQGPFLLPGYVINSGGGGGSFDCDDSKSCFPCMEAVDPPPIIYSQQNVNNNFLPGSASVAFIVKSNSIIGAATSNSPAYSWSLPTGCTIDWQNIVIEYDKSNIKGIQNSDPWIRKQNITINGSVENAIVIDRSTSTSQKIAEIKIPISGGVLPKITTHKTLSVTLYGSQKFYARIKSSTPWGTANPNSGYPTVNRWGNWNYTVDSVYTEMGSWGSSSGTTYDKGAVWKTDQTNISGVENLLESLNDVPNSGSGTVYGGIPVTRTNGVIRFTNFPSFSYEPVPDGTIVEVTLTFDINGVPHWSFSAPNCLQGSCGSQGGSNPITEEQLINSDFVEDDTDINTDNVIIDIFTEERIYGILIVDPETFAVIGENTDTINNDTDN